MNTRYCWSLPCGSDIRLTTSNARWQRSGAAFGNAGHNSLRAPGYFDVDVAVTREFRLLERLTLQARGEAFNALNHPNFRAPNANISSATFGQIRSARDPRIMQASMNLIF